MGANDGTFSGENPEEGEGEAEEGSEGEEEGKIRVSSKWFSWTTIIKNLMRPEY